MVMVNIDGNLYKEISSIIKDKAVDFPSIKNFVEKSVSKELKSIKEEINRKTTKENAFKNMQKIISKHENSKDKDAFFSEFLKKTLDSSLFKVVDNGEHRMIDVADLITLFRQGSSIVTKSGNANSIIKELKNMKNIHDVKSALLLFEIDGKLSLNKGVGLADEVISNFNPETNIIWSMHPADKNKELVHILGII